ncbi:hypothetical protein B0H17DRAFT_1134789 [Mycena rosella]|uniref:DDE Tnp4 domain-containing protein n=1 Tax=Mycena rosella TaxID=1033263 RepID=A0AAD7DEM0_MYCRO|nr:hypothetical protein B0H17DRAFT_1134789 [Mycena rosella]
MFHPKAKIPEKQIRIHIENAIGLHKGRFQSLFQLRINVYNHKRHLWAIMWICCCIILHNLIIQLEAGAEDQEWQDVMYNKWYAREGEQHHHRHEESDEESSGGEDPMPIFVELDVQQ